MAASLTVPQLSRSHNRFAPVPLTPSRGVIVLGGYGISVRVDRGHLCLSDGVGNERRESRLPRVNHGLRRLVIIGTEGSISLPAIEWLAAQKAGLVVLDRDGTVFAATGPGRSRDGRLRRAQALATSNGSAVAIVQMLIDQKLAAQAKIITDHFRNQAVVDAIASARDELTRAKTTDAIRWIEARAALAYWSAWHDLPVIFPTAALRRVPQHWRVFGARRSPLTGSPRVAVNPPNAMLNYLYAILEAEARLATLAVGLDPTMGLLHADTDARDSFACDLMEPLRPTVDEIVLNWLRRGPLNRAWFFERADGCCRLSDACTGGLSAASRTLTAEMATTAAHVARLLDDHESASRVEPTPKIRATARRATGTGLRATPQPSRICDNCGVLLRRGVRKCTRCFRADAGQQFAAVLREGRTSANDPAAQARRADTQRKHESAKRMWNPRSQPAWLTESVYDQQVRPRLSARTIQDLAETMGSSLSYAAAIRKGKRRPHPRHWSPLAVLAGVSRRTRS